MPAVRSPRPGATRLVRMLLVAFCVLSSVAVTARSLHAGPSAAAAGGPREIVFGALLSLTGEWSTLGQASQAALELATADINAQLAATDAPVRVRFIIADTRLDPATALAQVQTLAAQGVRVVVGPQSSAEVRALQPWVEANGIILISQGSTASALSLPDDGIFRLVPDDVREAEAVVALLAADGVQAIVPAWRTDVGNTGLHDSVHRLFTAAGGEVTNGAPYAPEATDYAAVVAQLRAQVSDAIAQYGASATAIYLAAFDEVVDLFAAVQDDPVLASVRWYGSDGVAQSDALLAEAQAARFAAQIGYPNPLVGLDERVRSRWQPVADQITARTGRDPDAFGLAAYDAAWIAALAQLAAGEQADRDLLRDAVQRTATGYAGITGDIILNAAGDRETGSFDFWAIREEDGVVRWVRVARYEPGPGGPGGGQITRLP